MRNKLALMMLTTLSFISCKKEAPAMDPNAAKPYPVVSVQMKNITGYTTFPTSIQGRVNNEVRAKIQGYITQVMVDEGQFVTQGQPLFRLETNILSQNANAAKAGISAADASVKAAQASVNAAQVEVNKLRPLVQKNIISNVQLQTAQANLSQAQAQLAQARAAREQASANYKGVAANIDYSVIRAPISGVVGSLPLKVGSLVGPTDQTPLTTISDTSEVFAYFSMNEKEYLNFLEDSYGATMPEKLRNMPSVELKLANGSMYQKKGKVEAVTGQIDKATGSIQFRASFPNGAKLLSNGNSGTIMLPKLYNGALVIPESSTYEQQGMVYAFKVQKDSVVNTPIQVTDRVDNYLVLNDGLKKGDQIVASGIAGLKNGSKIIPKKVDMDSLVKTIKPVF